MTASTRNVSSPSLAATVAPEDLRLGDLVALLNETYEYPSFLWCSDAAMNSPGEPVRIRWKSRMAGTPLKVTAVCLPFVFVEDPHRRFRTVDVRLCEIVRLERSYARLVWKQLRRRRALPADEQ